MHPAVPQTVSPNRPSACLFSPSGERAGLGAVGLPVCPGKLGTAVQHCPRGTSRSMHVGPRALSTYRLDKRSGVHHLRRRSVPVSPHPCIPPNTHAFLRTRPPARLQARQLAALAPQLPTEDPRLKSSTYDMVLSALLLNPAGAWRAWAAWLGGAAGRSSSLPCACAAAQRCLRGAHATKH